MRKVESYSVDDALDKDILDHLKTVGNKSNYIKELIRRDMKAGAQGGLTDTQESAVLKLIEKYIRENGITIQGEPEVDPEVLEALGQFEV